MCGSFSKSTWTTLGWCVQLRNSIIPKPTSTTLGILCLCVPREYPKVAAVFPNRLGRLSTDVPGCATPQNPSRIDSLSFIDHSVFCICANPENTRKLLQSFQIDLDDSGLLCLVAQLHNTRAGLISVLHRLGRHSVFCICANPENTRKLLQSFQIDLDDSQLMCLVAQLHKTRAGLILCPSLTLDDTQYFVFVRTPRIPESCCSLSKSTWMTLDCCVWLRNSTIPEPD